MIDIDFLYDVKISSNTINKLYESKTLDVLQDLTLNEEQIVKIINYFSSIKISCIDLLLLEETYIFFKLYSEIKSAFAKQDLLDIVPKINEDFHYIENII